MTVEIKVAGATFTKSVGRLGLPFIADAINYNLFGVDNAASSLNRAGGDATAIGGVPTYGAAYANFDNAKYFELDQRDAPFTLVAALRGPGSTVPGLGGFDYGLVKGWVVYEDGANISSYLNGSAGPGFTGKNFDTTDFQMIAMSMDGADAKVRLWDAGPNPSVATAAFTGSIDACPMRVGGPLGATLSGQAAAAVLYNRGLSTAELQEVRTYLQQIIGGRGETLL